MQDDDRSRRARTDEDTQPRIAWRERIEERLVAAIKRGREEEGDESPLPWPAAALAFLAGLFPRKRPPRERPA